MIAERDEKKEVASVATERPREVSEGEKEVKKELIAQMLRVAEVKPDDELRAEFITDLGELFFDKTIEAKGIDAIEDEKERVAAMEEVMTEVTKGLSMSDIRKIGEMDKKARENTSRGTFLRSLIARNTTSEQTASSLRLIGSQGESDFPTDEARNQALEKGIIQYVDVINTVQAYLIALDDNFHREAFLIGGLRPDDFRFKFQDTSFIFSQKGPFIPRVPFREDQPKEEREREQQMIEKKTWETFDKVRQKAQKVERGLTIKDKERIDEEIRQVNEKIAKIIELKEARKGLTAIQSQLDALQTAIDKRKTDIETKEGELDTLIQEGGKLWGVQFKKRAENEQAKAQKDTELETLRKKQEEDEEKRSKLQETKEQQEKRVRGIEEQAKHIREQLSILEEKHEVFQRQLAALEEKISNLNI